MTRNERKTSRVETAATGMAPGRHAVGVRVGVVTASPLLALGLIGLLEEAPGLEGVRLELNDITGSRDLAAVLLDAGCVEDLCGTVSRLRKKLPLLKIVVVGGAAPASEVQQMIGAGAKGYLLETAGEAEIRMAMEVVLDGSIWAPRKMLAKLIEEGTALAESEPPELPMEELSARECEVMNLLMSGRSNREIAAAMGVGPAAVKAHLGRMLRKTRSKNRIEMTLRWAERTQDPSGGDPQATG